jgi:hypothetical protein
MMPTPLPHSTSTERSRLLSVCAIRSRALERLYERREIVDNLIRSLESYLEYQQATGSPATFSAERKCS